MSNESKTGGAVVARDEDGIRLDRWFKRRWPHLNHIQINKMTRSGQIRVDGARAKPDTRLTAADFRRGDLWISLVVCAREFLDEREHRGRAVDEYAAGRSARRHGENRGEYE